MTEQQVLEKAIAKAIEGGWKSSKSTYDKLLAIGITEDLIIPLLAFDHGFAQAFFGDGLVGNKVPFGPGLGLSKGRTISAWKYHLQKMVIADDPIAYLGENL